MNYKAGRQWVGKIDFIGSGLTIELFTCVITVGIRQMKMDI